MSGNRDISVGQFSHDDCALTCGKGGIGDFCKHGRGGSERAARSSTVRRAHAGGHAWGERGDDGHATAHGEGDWIGPFCQHDGGARPIDVVGSRRGFSDFVD